VKGVMIDGKPARAKKVTIGGKARVGTKVFMTLGEGRKREVRMMLGALGYEVLRLERKAFGPLALGNLREGEYRSLTAGEIKKLKNCVKS